MKTLIIGGPFHGEWRDLFDGSAAWVDLVHGTTHQVAHTTWAVQAPGSDGVPIVLERYRLPMAIHPDITAHPAGSQIAHQAMTNMAITELMRAHAVNVPIPDQVPDSPAGLLGTDGRPLA